jgi:imidazole glycerol-phosphate synthase subunit HisH
MQLLFERSVELGGADGLGFLTGEVGPLDAPGLKIPQIGWNAIAWKRASRLTSGLPDPCAFYHVHSFAPRPADAGDVLATADYGGEFVTAVEREPVYGVQFHPEKSGPHGLRLLGNFAAICGVATPARRAA